MAREETIFLSGAVMNKEQKESLWFTRFTFNKICADLRPFLDKKAKYELPRECH